jgi:periplasmic protein TorT
MKRLANLILATALVVPAAGIVNAHADDWSFKVNNVVDGKVVPGTWTPIPVGDIHKNWRICVLLPHMNDPYWLGVNYGLVSEAKRDHADFQLYEAGGYTNLATQLNQFDNCLAQKYDAIMIAAISADGVGAAVKKAIAAGVVVIDLANGINEPSVSAHALTTFNDIGFAAGRYVVDDTKGQNTFAGFFPGPAGAGFSDNMVTGWQDATKDTNVKTQAMPRGDLTVTVQLKLVETALQADPNINYLVVCNAGAPGAVSTLRAKNKTKDVRVLGIGFDPQMYDMLKKHELVAVIADSQVAYARIGIDMAVRLLEHQKLPANRSGPAAAIIRDVDKDADLVSVNIAPRDFKATYTMKP